jgi:NTE family protein
MTTAFVLSGGASLGAVQVGMLEALAGKRIEPDLLVGTSVGAINAAWLAGHPDPADLVRLEDLWMSLRSRQIFPVSPTAALTGLISRRNHLVSGSGLEALISHHLPYERLEDASIPVHVVVTELLTGRERLLSDGPAIPALLASSAIPGVYPPVEIGGELYIDGGVSANSPVSHAVELGADTVYVLPTGYACALPRPPSGAIGMALHALTILLQRQLIVDVERNEHRAEIHVMPPLCPLSVFPGDFGHSAELIERARTVTREHLSKRARRDAAALLRFHPRH